MIRFKQGVNPQNVHESIWFALGVAYALHPQLDVDVTSMNDSTHGGNSLHYPRNSADGMCRAVDLRTRNLTTLAAANWYARVFDALNPLGYDIILHAPPDPIHLHIEFQPKTGDVKWLELITQGGKDDKNA